MFLSSVVGLQWIAMAWIVVPVALVLLSAMTFRPFLTRVQDSAQLALLTGLGLSLLGVLFFSAGGQGLELGPWIRIDGLTAWMGALVTFLAWINLRYSRRYLANDPGEVRFLRWFLATVAAVLVLVSASHLIVLMLAWFLISVTLHPLLCLYAGGQAREVAWHKFMVSRLGDFAFLLGVVWLYQRFGTFDLTTLAQAIAVESGVSLTVPAVAFAMAAVLRCAQVPFHGWLIRVMEAPTPVSALLHAGIINLGGFLWLRMAPILETSVAGHVVLAVFGAFTALTAGLIMMAQPSIKHSLAWSTSAQMGFMLLELGLGAYTLALLHLLAHSLYKAHAFLGTGRIVLSANHGGASLRPRAMPSLLLWTVLLAPPLVYVASQFGGFQPVLLMVMLLSMAHVVSVAAPSLPKRSRGFLLLSALALPFVYLLWAPVLSATVTQPASALGSAQATIEILLLLAFAMQFLMLTAVRWWPAHRWSRSVLAHCRNDFHLSAPGDRVVKQVMRTPLFSGNTNVTFHQQAQGARS